MKKDFEQKKKEWLEKMGFSQDGKTYVITGETYSIKDELKAKGFKYDGILHWHKSTIEEEYIDRTIEVKLNDVIEMNAWGSGHYKENANKIFNNAGTPSNSSSDWIAAPGDTIKNLKVQLIKKASFNGKWGLTNVITFIDENENILTWFTTTTPIFMVGDWLLISSANVKNLTEYKGEKQTQITRPRLKELPA